MESYGDDFSEDDPVPKFLIFLQLTFTPYDAPVLTYTNSRASHEAIYEEKARTAQKQAVISLKKSSNRPRAGIFKKPRTRRRYQNLNRAEIKCS